MRKFTYVNGVLKMVTGSRNINECISFLKVKGVEFARVGNKISFINPKGDSVVWEYKE